MNPLRGGLLFVFGAAVGFAGGYLAGSALLALWYAGASVPAGQAAAYAATGTWLIASATALGGGATALFLARRRATPLPPIARLVRGALAGLVLGPLASAVAGAGVGLGFAVYFDTFVGGDGQTTLVIPFLAILAGLCSLPGSVLIGAAVGAGEGFYARREEAAAGRE